MQIDASWQALSHEAARLIDVPLQQMLAGDPKRATEFSLRVGPVYANFSRQRFDDKALGVLFGMARDAGVPAAFRAMFDGVHVNGSEDRPALHTALRSALGEGQTAAAAGAEVAAALTSMQAL